jgi:hypothetical protein
MNELQPMRSPEPPNRHSALKTQAPPKEPLREPAQTEDGDEKYDTSRMACTD